MGYGWNVTTLEELDRRFYADHVDEHARFDLMVRDRLAPDAFALDAGAGRGLMFPYDHRKHVHRLVGVDLDPAVAGNPNVHHAIVADLMALPFRDGVFDVVFSKFVFEHLERPATVMRELRRVLKSGGYLVIHTPSRWHYVSLVAALTPTSVHRWYRARLGWDHAGTFRTHYRANDVPTLARLTARTGFSLCRVELMEGKPFYLAVHPLAYRVGIAYERLVNRYRVLARFRANILAEFRVGDDGVRATPHGGFVETPPECRGRLGRG